MNIYLIRHGESRGNVDKSEYFRNPDSEIELTDKGKLDAVNAAFKIVDIVDTFNQQKSYPSNEVTRFSLFHSTYKRATQTANIIQNTINDGYLCTVDDILPSPLCIEREWGSLRDIVSARLKTDEHFNFYYRPVNGESFCDTYKRAAIFHQWLLNTTKCENNIVVAHGEFNKVYLMHLLNWNISEFEKWKNQRNGEVWLIRDGELSSITPLTTSPYKK